MVVSSRKAGVTAVLAAFLLICAMFVTTPKAFADDNMADLNAKVEETAQQYNDAVAAAAAIDDRIAENQAKIQDLETQIAETKEVSSEAVKSLYIYQRSTPSLVNLVFTSSDVSGLFGTLDYLNRYEQKNLDVIQDRIDAKAELEATQTQLSADKVAADQAKAAAEQALQDAQAAREAAMEEALAEAQAQLQAEQAARDARVAADSSDTTDEVSSTVTDSDVDWAMPKEDFVNAWTTRIDNYLAGSPMAGCGHAFAEAAWTYGVDPRWSPAIANTESSKGLYCFSSYNAWGWGTSSWSSWDEAIDAHVAGLARTYGFTLTLSAAQKYCPPNYQSWYNSTLAQMNMI